MIGVGDYTMVYADLTRLQTRLNSYSNVDTDLTTEAITTSDNMINSYLNDEIPGYTTPSPIPAVLEEVGVLFANMAALHILFGNSDDVLKVSTELKEEGYKLLKQYVNAYESSTLNEGTNIFIDTIYNADQMEEDEEEDV